MVWRRGEEEEEEEEVEEDVKKKWSEEVEEDVKKKWSERLKLSSFVFSFVHHLHVDLLSSPFLPQSVFL